MRRLRGEGWRGPAARVALALSVLSLALVPARASADRLALVIGNGAYAHAGPLVNPTRDAAAIADRLGKLGFDVLEREDIDNNHLRDAIVTFKHKVHDGDLVVIYYAGHGMEENGVDYMIPVDADIRAEGDLQDLGYDISKLFFDDLKNVSLVFMFDACRDNVFEDRIGARRAGTNPAARAGRLILMAAGPGQQSFDAAPGSSGDANSVFATAVLNALAIRNLESTDFVRQVTREVSRRTNDRQTPSLSGTLMEKIFFNGGDPLPPAGLALPTASPASGQGEDPPVPQPPPPLQVADANAPGTRTPTIAPDVSDLLPPRIGAAQDMATAPAPRLSPLLDAPAGARSSSAAAPPATTPTALPGPPPAATPTPVAAWTSALPSSASPSPSASAPAPRAQVEAMLDTIHRAAAPPGSYTIAALGFGNLPQRPMMTPPPSVDIPASFCSQAALNQFHDEVYLPARAAAYANNERAIQYLKDLDSLRREYTSQVNGFYVVVTKESQDYKSIADQQFAESEKYRKMFDTIIDTPIQPCK